MKPPPSAGVFLFVHCQSGHSLPCTGNFVERVPVATRLSWHSAIRPTGPAWHRLKKYSRKRQACRKHIYG